MEHRWGRRIEMKLPVQLIIASLGPVHARIEDVSISGAFVRTAPLALGLGLDVILRRSRGHGRERIAAHVVRQTRDGVGIEWYDIAPRLICALLSPILPLMPSEAVSRLQT